MKEDTQKSVILYDTTLRDGQQAEGVSYSVDDKIRIITLLDLFGVRYIEAGWPGANPKDTEVFERMKKISLTQAKLVAFGSTCKPGLSVAEDPNLGALLVAGTEVITIFGKTWDLHVTDALNIPLAENLELISETVAYLKKKDKEVIFDAEHFFDGYKNNPEYALKALRAAQDARADCIVLCDTNGGLLPLEIPPILEKVREVIHIPLGIHCHNDSETAVANSLTAVQLGINHVQGTINGIGERCGNGNLCSIIPGIKLKLRMDCGISEEQLKELTNVSRFVNEIANLNPWDKQPYVGISAFAHKAGIHVSAIRKNAMTYEHIDPDLVGASRRVLMSDQSGKSNLLYNACELGLSLEQGGQEAIEVLEQLKALEKEGFQFEAAEASLRVLIAKMRKKCRNFFELIGYRVIVEKREGDIIPITEATIRIRVNGEERYTVAIGDGPLNALDTAFREALRGFYPIVDSTSLYDYKVRIINGNGSRTGQQGTGAKTRVLISTKDQSSFWGTVGVSENIIEASWQALVHSIEYKFLREDEAGRL